MSVPHKDSHSQLFEQEVENVQARLKTYLLATLGNVTDANDVLQETNLVVWRKREDFEPGTSFWAWTQKIAFFQVMAFRKKLSRNRIILDNDVAHMIATEAPEILDEDYTRSKRLKSCLSELPEQQRKYVEGHYLEGKSLKKLAQQFQSTATAVSQTLYRARHNLLQCLTRRNP